MNYVDLTSVVPANERRSGYLVDISSLQLADAQDGKNATSWLHAISIGEYKHPLWGKLSFTPERIKRFADNIVNNIRGIDLAVDYAHQNVNEAAGWIKAADVRPNGLWLLVEWTQKAAEKIRNKEFRYFSPEFVDEWEDATGNKFKDVLLGGGLTNRPFLKDLLPVNLSEYYEKEDKEEKEDESMEFKELLKALGLSEDASEEDALQAVTKLQETAKANPPADDDDPAKKLAEDENPEVKALQEQVILLQAANRLSEARRLTDAWTTGGKKFAMPTAVTEKLTDVISQGSTKLSEDLTEIVDHLLEHGLVSLDEEGSTGGGKKRLNEETDTATTRFDAAVKKLQEENEGMSYIDAVSEVSRDEKLFEEYRREQITGTLTEEEVN